MTQPITIECGNRRAVINGDRVALQMLHNKKKPTGVWPEQSVSDGATRLYVAQAWAIKGILDDDFCGVQRGRH